MHLYGKPSARCMPSSTLWLSYSHFACLDQVPVPKRQGARFAKWRAALKVGKHLPSEAVVQKNAVQLAEYAAICQVCPRAFLHKIQLSRLVSGLTHCNLHNSLVAQLCCVCILLRSWKAMCWER